MRRQTGRLLLATLILVSTRNAGAQDDIKKDLEQCHSAHTPKHCKAALPACVRAIAALSMAPEDPKRDEDYRSSLTAAGDCELQVGGYANAELDFRAALVIDQRRKGAEHQVVAESLDNVAFALSGQGKYEAAELLFRQALAMRLRLLGAEHPDVAGSIHNVAVMLSSQGVIEAAEPLFRQALAMMQKLQGAEHPDVAQILTHLAALLKQQGRYSGSESLYRQALAMRQKLLGTEHVDVATSLDGLAVVLCYQGRCEAGETVSRQALAMRQKLLGAEHPDVAQSLNSLGGSLQCQGKYEAAETLHRQVLAMRQKLLGSEHPDVAQSLNNLAAVLTGQAKYEAAETLHRQVLAMRQKLLGSKHPDVAQSLNNLAAVLATQGKYEESETLNWQALALRQQLLGTEHPDVAQSLNNLAVVLVRREQSPTAQHLFAKAAEIAESVLRVTSSETRMKLALGKVRAAEDALFGLLLEQRHAEGLNRLVLTMALLRKGRTAEAGATANRLLHQRLGNTKTKAMFELWQQVRQQREALLFGGIGKLSLDTYRERLKELSLQADELEGQLVMLVPELVQFQPPKFDEILSSVAARLPKDGALIEVLRIRPYNFTAKGTEARWKTPHYLALVMTQDQRIVTRDLGEAATLESHVQDLLSALRTPASDPAQRAKALYEQVLKPVLPASANHVYLSLDGTLNLIPFDALHDGADYLLGRKTFHYLTSGRDLLRTNVASPRQAALVLGDPDFGQARKDPQDSGEETFYRRLARLQRLPGAEEEANQISSLLHVSPIVGKDAKESVVRAAEAPWVLHIASHGLYLRGQLVPGSDGRGAIPFDERKGVLFGNFGGEPMVPKGDTDALSRSALVLADAALGDAAKSAAEDGLLTADESRSLSLFGTQLVVLSACDTGQGDLSVGQGVYGLRRAFLVAGTETLVTSLWQVSDAATGKLMLKYYEKLLKEKKGRLEGMQEAMKEMRDKYKHPYYWAPFLVIGSDGPLRPPANWSQQ